MQSVEPQVTNSQRFVGIDLMRFVAAVSIVWLHTVNSTLLQESSVLGRFAVPFFTVAAVFMIFVSSSKKPQPSFWNYANRRFTRIYVPFMLWSLFYLIVRAINRIVSSSDAPLIGNDILWTGTTHHLWFLPFILVVSLITFPLTRLVVGETRAKALLFVLSIALSVSLFIWRIPNPYVTLGYTGALSYEVLPAVFFGIVVSLIYLSSKQHWITSGYIATFGFIIFLSALTILLSSGRNILVENIAGLGAFLLALYPFQTKVANRLQALGDMSFAIYLVHIVFVEGMQDMAALVHLTQSAGLDLFIFITSVLLSIGAAWLLQRTAYAKFLGAA